MKEKDKKANKLPVAKKDQGLDLGALIEYAEQEGGFDIVPSEKGSKEGKAMTVMKGQTSDRLQSIMEQMKTLASQAQELKERAEIHEMIYLATVNFSPVMGKHYFLYQKGPGEYRVSLIGPDEWGKSCPFELAIARVKFLHDETWQIIDLFENEL